MTQSAQPIIIIDDEEDMRNSIAQWMELTGFSPRTFASGKEALATIDPDFPGVVITDIRMPEMDGTEVLAQLQARDKSLPVLMITGHGDVPLAVECMRGGAYDFIEKPFDPERLADLVKRAADARQLAVDNRKLRAELSDGSVLMRRLIGSSEPMSALRDNIHKMAQSDSALIIRGENGSGRSLAARAVHAVSPRAGRPLNRLNCAAQSPLELEMSLFGHPSDTDSRALLTGQNGGTLILEHISALPQILQRRLAEHLSQDKPSLPRIITLFETGQDMADISPELFHRLSGLELMVPPLRACGTDILTIFDFYLRQFAQENDSPAPDVRPEDATLLLEYSWPGNIRQLINIAERLALQGKGQRLEDVMPGQDPLPLDADPARSTLKEQVDQFERLRIHACLKRHSGTISRVMEELNLPRRTLNEKMAKYGLHRSDYV